MAASELASADGLADDQITSDTNNIKYGLLIVKIHSTYLVRFQTLLLGVGVEEETADNHKQPQRCFEDTAATSLKFQDTTDELNTCSHLRRPRAGF